PRSSNAASLLGAERDDLETVVLKGRINWSFNFSLFIVRGEITEVLPWGEQQRKIQRILKKRKMERISRQTTQL
ncbi:hypothetical protein Nmel_002149, partial [Mimus melanotis]